MLWKVAVDWDIYRAEPWRFIVGFGVFGVTLAGVVTMGAKKRARLAAERERFEALVADRALM